MFYLALILISPFFKIYSCLSYFDIPIKGDSLSGYFITALVGTPSQELNLLIDTGSSNIAVAAVPQLTNSKYFAYFNSSTFHLNNEEVHLRYVQGDWKGVIGSDILNICSPNDCSLFCNISCMTSMRNIFDDESKFQGILGLAYSSIAQPSSYVNSFLDTFIQTKLIKNSFTLDLCGSYFNIKMPSNCGNLRLGDSNEDNFKNVMYTPIVHELYYEITVINLKVGFKSVPFKCQDINQNKSIIDSGTTELNVPSSMYDYIISEIRSYPKDASLHKFWINETVICLENKPINTSMFPTILLTLYHSKNSSFDLHISPKLYLLPHLNSTSNCAKLGIGRSSFGIVIGSTVLKGFHVVFDRENKRIGFSEPKKYVDDFISAVSNKLVYDSDFDHCIRSDLSDDTNISPLIILLLIGISILAILFLYALLSWIWKFHITGDDNLSETNSLIEDGD